MPRTAFMNASTCFVLQINDLLKKDGTSNFKLAGDKVVRIPTPKMPPGVHLILIDDSLVAELGEKPDFRKYFNV